jgi:hypothetical protein
MAFTVEQLQAALSAQMNGKGVKKGAGLFSKETLNVTKSVAMKGVEAVGGILPPTRNELRREVAKLEMNDAQSMAYNLLIVERLAEYGIDLGITSEDVQEKADDLLEDYHLRQAAQKQAIKDAKKAERQAKADAWKAKFMSSGLTPQAFEDIVEIKEEEEIVEVPQDAGRSGFDEPEEESTGGGQPTTYVFKGIPEDEE